MVSRAFTALTTNPTHPPRPVLHPKPRPRSQVARPSPSSGQAQLWLTQTCCASAPAGFSQWHRHVPQGCESRSYARPRRLHQRAAGSPVGARPRACPRSLACSLSALIYQNCRVGPTAPPSTEQANADDMGHGDGTAHATLYGGAALLVLAETNDGFLIHAFRNA